MEIRRRSLTAPERPLLPPPAAATMPRLTGTLRPLTPDEQPIDEQRVPPPEHYDEPVTYRREIVIREYYDQLPDGRQVPTVPTGRLAPASRRRAPRYEGYDEPRPRRRRPAPQPLWIQALQVFALGLAGYAGWAFFADRGIAPPPPAALERAIGGTVARVNGLVAASVAQEQPAAVAAPAGALAPVGVLQGPPSLTAAQIDTILASYDSPAQGSGQAWYAGGVESGIDPAYAVAFFVHESTAGTAQGWAGWKDYGSRASTHNVGNIICAGYPTCFNRFRDYPSWEAGIKDWYRLIKVEYIEGRGHKTVADVIPVYAPSFENNVPAYIAAVEQLVTGWRAKYPQPAAAPVTLTATLRAEAADGGARVVGTLRNEGTEPITIPLAEVSIKDRAGKVYGLNGQGQSTLQPGQEVPINLLVPAPPDAGLILLAGGAAFPIE